MFVVRERARRQKRNGEAFLKLQLGDVTGTVEAVVWDGVDELSTAAAPGGVVRVRRPLLGRRSATARRITVRALRRRRAAASTSLADLHEGPARPVDQMAADLRELVAHGPATRTCASCSTRCFDRDSEIWRRWHEAPAAKYYHQAYRHGLLEHCLSVAQGVSALAATFPGIDRDVAVTGALLHDIGKIEAYAGRERRDRADRRRQAPGRDPARLLPRAPRDRGDRRLPAPTPRRPCSTSCSATTASSSTAARWCPARARPRSCT